MQLIPVVEFEPFAFQTVEREFPTDSDRQSWDDYWQNSLADGITDIDPYLLQDSPSPTAKAIAERLIFCT